MRGVVITGSRDWTETAPIEQALRGADALIVGDCPTGADAIALQTAKAWDIIAIVLTADWKGLGKKAGPVRNQAIADRAASELAGGMEVCCYAFPLAGSRGTHDCRQRLERAGFRVTLPVAPVQEVLW